MRMENRFENGYFVSRTFFVWLIGAGKIRIPSNAVDECVGMAPLFI